MPCVHRNLITVGVYSRLHILSQVTNIQSKPFLTHCPSCILYTAHNLGRIFKLHTVACTPRLNFLFHMPWNTEVQLFTCKQHARHSRTCAIVSTNLMPVEHISCSHRVSIITLQQPAQKNSWPTTPCRSWPTNTHSFNYAYPQSCRIWNNLSDTSTHVCRGAVSWSIVPYTEHLPLLLPTNENTT